MAVLVASYHCDKTSDKATWGRKGLAHRVQSVLDGEAWWQERKVAGHVVSTARKQRVMKPGPQLFFCFIQSRTPACEIVLSTFRIGLPT